MVYVKVVCYLIRVRYVHTYYTRGDVYGTESFGFTFLMQILVLNISSFVSLEIVIFFCFTIEILYLW